MTKPVAALTQWPESVHSKARAANRKHLIESIDFHTPGIPPELAPTVCTCGWSGPAMKLQDHRVSQGQRRASLSGGGGRVNDHAA